MQRILVIEDSTEYRGFMAELLRLCGYLLLEAEDGDAGIRLAEEQAPDLIICDLHLPRVDGFSTLQTIRRKQRHHTPFLFVTGDSDPMQIHRGLNLGAEAYLIKPISAQEFVRAVRTHLVTGGAELPMNSSSQRMKSASPLSS